MQTLPTFPFTAYVPIVSKRRQTRSHFWLIVWSIAGALLLAGCGGTPNPSAAPTTGSPPTSAGTPGTQATISAKDAWVRAAVVAASDTSGSTGNDHGGSMNNGQHGGMNMGSGSNSAAYMTLVNQTDTSDALISATTDVAETVELHTVIDDNGVMKMRPVEKIDLPAGGEQQLKPGGFHIMLLNIKKDLNEGDTVHLTLTFQNGGTLEVDAPVKK